MLDFSKHMNRILELDPQKSTARVQPGVVLYEVHGEGHMINVTGRLSSRRAKLATIDAFLAEHLAAIDVSSSAAEEARS